MDAVSPEDIKALLTSANELKAGAMFFLGFLSVLGFSMFGIWIWNRHKDRLAASDVVHIEAAAEAAKLAAEEKRTADLTHAILTLGTVSGTHEKQSQDRITALMQQLKDNSAELAKALAAQTATFTQMQNKTNDMVAKTFSGLRETMQELLDRQRGVINTTDSLRIIEQSFDTYICTELIRICTASIESNNYASRATFVKARVTLALTNVIDKAIKYLRDYSLTVDVNAFFPLKSQTSTYFAGQAGAEKGEYVIVSTVWGILRELHENGNAHDDCTRQQAVEICNVLITREVSTAFHIGRTQALNIYSDNIPKIDDVNESHEYAPHKQDNNHG